MEVSLDVFSGEGATEVSQKRSSTSEAIYSNSNHCKQLVFTLRVSVVGFHFTHNIKNYCCHFNLHFPSQGREDDITSTMVHFHIFVIFSCTFFM